MFIENNYNLNYFYFKYYLENYKNFKKLYFKDV